MNLRNLLEGCGVGIALTLSYIWQPLAPAHIQGLFLRVLPVSSVAGGAALDLIGASLLCWGVLTLLERGREPEKTPAWALLMALVPAVVLHSVLRLAEVNLRIPTTLMMSVVLLAPLLALWRLWPRGYHQLVAAFRLGCICVGVCVLWALPELAYGALHPRHPDAMESNRETNSGLANAGQERIVWVLLDELSYDQTFDHRQPNLKLGNFDALRAVSTSFGDVQPAGYLTDQIVPSLLTGRTVAEIKSAENGSLLMKESSAGHWERFDQESTLFGDAERLGWKTAIAGWFNPYCRLFGSVVDRCIWEPESRMFPGHMSASNSALENALAPLGAKFHVDADSRLAAEHGKSYGILMAHGVDMIREDQERFVFIHLPVPHPPGIYDRRTGRMRVGGSYLDNLALADKTVGDLRAEIEHSAAAKSTILIVSSDHSMRVPKWRGSGSWTAEDEHVFGNHFETRPVLMVHFAGEQTGRTVNAPFAEIRTHAMIEAMLQEKITAEPDLDTWVEAGE